MQIKTISYIKQHAANLELNEPIVVTQGGKPVYRIESEASAQARDKSIALLKLANLAERDIREGRTISLDDAKERLKSDLGFIDDQG